MHLSGVREDAEPSGIHAVNDIPVLAVRRFFIPLIDRRVNRPCIPEAVHQEYYFLLLDLIFFKDRLLGIFDHRAALPSVFLLIGIQFIHDHAGHGVIIIQDILIAGDVFQRLLMLRAQGLDLKPDQAVQAHLQDGRRLTLCKPQQGSHLLRDIGFEFNIVGHTVHKACPGVFDRFTAPEDLDHQIDHIAGLDQTFLDLALLPLFCKQGLVFPRSQLELEIHMVLNDLLESQRLRTPVRHGQHIDAERVFQTGLFVEHVLQVLHIRPALQFQDDPDSFFGGLIGNIHNVRGLL